MYLANPECYLFKMGFHTILSPVRQTVLHIKNPFLRLDTDAGNSIYPEAQTPIFLFLQNKQNTLAN